MAEGYEFQKSTSKVASINLTQLQFLLSKGCTDAECAEFFGIKIDAYAKFKERHPDFRALVEDWKFAANERVKRALFERATGYSALEIKVMVINDQVVQVRVPKHWPPDTTACIYWLQNRTRNSEERWRSFKPTEDVPDRSNTKVDLNPDALNDAAEAYAQLLEKAKA